MQVTQRFAQLLTQNVGNVIVGKSAAVELIMIAMLCKGHVLIEDVPGVGKTTLASALAKSIDCSFKRIQFTPDITPSDITGFSIVNMKTGELEYRKGLVMSQMVLCDEINRTSPKTQSSLLEVMEEGHVTVDGVTYAMPQPFMVLATQNPVDFVGTYPLPEAQLDRFLMRISMASPTKEQERAILQRFMKEEPLETLQSVCTREDILALQKQAKEIYIHPVLLDYMIDLVQATRSWPNIDMGVSPRGSLALVRAVRAYALVRGGAYVVPEDIKTVAVPVLAHRLQLSGSVGSTDAQKKAMTDVLSSVALPTEDWSK